jgi:ubiquinone/menaquinone biosynthesis C-methylase UbiE
MKTNLVERLWVDGPWRIPFLAGEIRFFKGLCEVAAAARMLEVGCGRGAGARLILKHYGPKRLEAIDIDPDMIRRARRWTRPSLAQRLDFRVADAQELPFPDGCMDAVFNFGIIHHLEDWRRGIGEIARVLRPGGVFLFEEIYPALYAGFLLRRILAHPRQDRFAGPEYRAALEGSGLRLVKGCWETKYRILGAAIRE